MGDSNRRGDRNCSSVAAIAHNTLCSSDSPGKAALSDRPASISLRSRQVNQVRVNQQPVVYCKRACTSSKRTSRSIQEDIWRHVHMWCTPSPPPSDSCPPVAGAGTPAAAAGSTPAAGPWLGARPAACCAAWNAACASCSPAACACSCAPMAACAACASSLRRCSSRRSRNTWSRAACARRHDPTPLRSSCQKRDQGCERRTTAENLPEATLQDLGC